MANYTTEIEQTSPFNFTPAGQEMILIASSDLCVATELNVKFCCKLVVFRNVTTPTLVGTFKTTPNNAGVGIFDIGNIIGNYVSSDNLATVDSKWKIKGAYGKRVPIHIIDKFSRSTESIIVCFAKIYTEYTDSTSGAREATSEIDGLNTILFNGYIKNTDLLKWVDSDDKGFGFDMTDFLIKSSSTRKLLSNSPSIQWARSGDYGTMAFIAYHTVDGTSYNDVAYVKFIFYPEYDASGTTSGNVQLALSEENGGYDAGLYTHLSGRILQFGAFPANVKTWSNDFNTQLNDEMKSYKIGLYNNDDTLISEEKIVNILCPNLKGYEQVRLTWLNQWGTWDYFTFNQKSVKTISTKGTTYQQLGGTWNKSEYNPYGYKGGKKAFRVNATETIKMNTDYLTEEHSDWFEELINSPQVYILKDWESPRQYLDEQGGLFNLLNQYVTPVTLKTTSFTKKTVANDRLIQYTFEVEKSRNLRTQSV